MAKSEGKPSHNLKFYKYAKALSSRITALRKKNNETMEELATACGVTRGTIHKIEHPPLNEDLSIATIWTIAEHYKVSLSELLSGIDADEEKSASWAISSGLLEKEDYLALSLVPEMNSLQFRADLTDQACLVASDENQLEILASHSAKLRQVRYKLLLKQRSESNS